MITYRSFMNPGVSEGESIGRLFYDRDEQPHGSTKYLELAQAEDYVLFRIVHESSEQRYAHDSYRKIFESRVSISDAPAIADFLLTDLDPTVEYPSATFTSEYDDDLIITLTEQGATLGGDLGDRIIKIRLDADDTATVRMMLRDMFAAYVDMLDRQVSLTATVEDFRRAANKLDDHLTHLILEETEYRGLDGTDTITITFPDQYEADRVEEAFKFEYGATVGQWHAYLAELDAQREDDLCTLIVAELGFSLGELPYGETFSHMHWITLPNAHYDTFTTAVHKAAMTLR